MFRERIIVDQFKVPECKDGEKNSFTMLVCQADNRDELQKYLVENSIQSLIYYGTPLHLQKASKNLNYKIGDFPVTEEQSKNILTLPINQFLKKNEIKYISNLVNKFYS